MSSPLFQTLGRKVILLTLGGLCIIGSYTLGKHTAGSVQPFTLIEAGGNTVAGDLDENGRVDLADIILILEAVQGYTELSPQQYTADPNGDGDITIDDALRLLHNLSLQ